MTKRAYVSFDEDIPKLRISCSTISIFDRASLGCMLAVRGLVRYTGIMLSFLQSAENLGTIQTPVVKGASREKRLFLSYSLLYKIVYLKSGA